jgi:hypothetical protein
LLQHECVPRIFCSMVTPRSRDDFALRFSGSDEASLREYLNTTLVQVAAKVGSNRAQKLFGSMRRLGDVALVMFRSLD